MRLKKASLIMTTLLIILVGLVGCGKNKELSNYEQGITCIQESRFADALSYFETALSDEGEDLKMVNRGIGLAYLGLGEYDKAIASFEESLSLSNGLLSDVDFDINYYIAVAQYKSGKIEDAINTYNAILAVDKKQPDAYYLRGKLYLDLDRVNDAKNDFDEAIRLDKNNSSLYINIYNDLVEHGMEGDAKGYINSGIATVSRPTDYELGVFNYYLGDYTQARNYFEESSETKKSAEGIVYLGRTYEALDDKAYATSLYEAFISDNATGAIVYNELGLLKASDKDYEGALSAFEAGLQLEDVSCKQTLMFNRIVANEFLGNFEAAKNEMEEYITLYPNDEVAKHEHIFLRTR